MQTLNREQFAELLQQANVKARLRRDLRFAPETITDWDIELLAVADRTGDKGVLLIELDGGFYVLSYTLLRKIADKTGRSKPITCDFCCTWQAGGKAGRITFTRPSDQHTFTFLCCGGLKCTWHVRDKTPESRLSRTQLHEDLNTAQRIARLHTRLQEIIDIVGALPIPL